jgi:hypothetical protein
MIRSLILTFLLGWGLWLLLDKEGPAYTHAARIQGGEDTLLDFQVGFDLLKAGEPGAAFAFLWYHHYLILTLLIALVAAFALPPLRRSLGSGWRRGSAALKGRRGRSDAEASKDRPGDSE